MRRAPDCALPSAVFASVILAAAGLISSCDLIAPMSSEELSQSWQEARNQAFKFDKAGEKEKAEERYQKTILLAEKFGLQDTRLASSYSELADFYAHGNTVDKAASYYKKALAIYESALSPGSSKLSTDNLLLAGVILANKNRLAEILRAQKKYSEAENQYKTALEVAKQYAVPSQTLQQVVAHYCAMLCELNREKDAEKIGESWRHVQSLPQIK